MNLASIQKLDKKKIISLFGVMIFFITSWAPFIEGSFLGSFVGNDMMRSVLKFFIVILVVLSMFIESRIKIPGLFELIVAVGVLIYRAYNIFYAYEYKGIGIICITVGIFFCFQSDKVRANVFKYFKYFMIIMSVVSIICYISYVSNLGFPYRIITRSDGIFWVDYKLCYLVNQYGLIRLCGIFEEPGWFGTWAAFFLCADGINFRKKGNIILLFAGTLSFSLAFFLLIIIYYLLKNLSNWKQWIWVFVIAVLYLFVLPNVKTGNDEIDQVIGRFKITREGLAGDNRYGGLFEAVWDQAIQSGRIWVGYGAGYAEKYGTGEGEGLASIKSYFVNFGIIGSFIIFAPIFIVSIRQSLKQKNKELLFYTLLTFISLYQRPYLFWEPYLIIYLCGRSYIILNGMDSDILVPNLNQTL